MITIVLERVKGNQWDIRTKHGHFFCSTNQENAHEAIDWCRNYLSSFDFNYDLEVINRKVGCKENGMYSKESRKP